MRYRLSVAILLASCAPVWAQSSTAISTSRSDSAALAASRSTAIGGGNATGGSAAGGNASVTLAGAPASTSSTVHQDVSGTQTLKNVPLVSAPGLSAAGIETCLGSASGGGAFVGTGFSLGTTYPDNDCNRRLYARTLFAMAQAMKNPRLADAAMDEHCLAPDIQYVMPDVCGRVLPQRVAPIANAAYAQAGGPSQSGYYYEDVSTYRGGPIMLISGKTGAEYLCNSYDLSHQRCRDGRGVTHRKPAARQLAVSTKPKATQSKEVIVP